MSNVSAVQGLYEAFSRGDVPSVIAFLDDDIAWTEAEGFPYSGTYHGPNSVLDSVFMRLATEWDGYTALPAEFIDGGDTVVVLGTYSGTYKATGKGFRADFVHVWKIKAGKAVRFVQYTDTLLVSRALQ